VQSYGSSGEQARAVLSGLEADVVALSLEPDMTTLVRGGLVASNWNKDAFKGMVTRSVVVFVVRDGNPKEIRDWKDLVKPGVEVVTPNVQTSGGAKWNVMAAYGAQRRAKRTHKQAVAYLRQLYRHVASQDSPRTRARARPCRRSWPVAATSCSRTRTRRSSPARRDRRLPT
jgi:ABC-type sulfate transport system substrate-binding protein